jgi:hypothetical protein
MLRIARRMKLGGGAVVVAGLSASLVGAGGMKALKGNAVAAEAGALDRQLQSSLLLTTSTP